MKKKVTIVALIALLLVLLTGLFFFIMLKVTAEETPEVEVVDITMFSAYTDHEVYQDIPAMKTENGKFSAVEDYGKKDYLMNVNGSTVEEYKE